MSVLIGELFNAFFPKFCPDCGKKIGISEFVCRECVAKIEAMSYVRSGGKHYDRLFYRGDYAGEMGLLVRKYKYVPKPSLAKFFAGLFYEMIEKFPPTPHAVLTYVPPTFSSLKEKGFNHTKTLCKEVSKRSGISYKDLLEAGNNESFQVGKTRSEREKSIIGKYSVNLKNLYKTSGNILLIDDVFTTGATVEECARVLKEAGAREVWVYVMAKA